jgi:hypothetical protein
MPRYVFPLDPDCPGVVHAFQIQVPDDCTINDEFVPAGTWIDDPMAAPVWDDLMADFEKRHRAKCARCLDYGFDNVDVDY